MFEPEQNILKVKLDIHVRFSVKVYDLLYDYVF